ncbi:hypothetical protein QQS21_003667 [Conoideocrella luteorostrata]|uniref:TNT domain-containing protein n=1 Tax=Conoideocrella luteorostrata TaxID=1105319 RepID=A0AAJ0CT06_9HYPO|nr:hypothetical protein QQS21_003667 [Conoideocrella luteorostrata]
MQISLAFVSAVLGFARLALAGPVPEKSINCTGTRDNKEKASFYVCGDERLGPKFPDYFETRRESAPVEAYIISCLVNDYVPFGGMQPGDFLAKYWNGTAEKGGWIYPPANGFAKNNKGVFDIHHQEAEIDHYLDRFGPENGTFLGSIGTPYSKRAISPNNLNPRPNWPIQPDANIYNNYNAYKVIESFKVYKGRIAPWFEQKGAGLQYMLEAGDTVEKLVSAGKLRKLSPQDLIDSRVFHGDKCALERPPIKFSGALDTFLLGSSHG